MRFSIEAEQSLVGGLLLDPNRLDDVLEITCAEDFYSADNRSIMRYITEVAQAGRTADVITVADAMSDAWMLDSVGGIAYLVELANNTPGSSNVAAYAHIVAERAVERRISEAGQRIAELGEDESIGVDDKLDVLHSELAGLERRDNAGIVKFNDIIKSRVQAIDGKFRNTTPRGMYTGFSALDERFMGIGNTDLWVVAARPSMGKTAFAMNVAYNQAAQGKEVIIFSMEMSKDQLTDRLISSVSGINSNLIRSGKLMEPDWPALGAGISKLKDLKIHIIDIAGIDIHRAKAIARKFSRFGKIGLIVIDYLQLMTDSKTKNRFEEVSSVSRELKVMAKMIGCPVLALSQLNRGVENRSIKKPGLADLRESGQIEQDADLITFIYRDEYYNQDTPNKCTAEMITAKFREGEVGTDILGTELQYARFKDIDYSNYQFDYKPQESKPQRSGGFS